MTGPSWRKRWKRTSPAHRGAAARALADEFRPVRMPPWWLPALLAASVLGHGAILLALLSAKTATQSLAPQAEHAYLRKLIQKERSKHVLRDVKVGLDSAAPAPDPEAFVSETISESVSKDVVQTAANLLNVKLQEDLTQHIATTLADEIQEASRRIVAGEISSDDIKQLRKKWQEQAYVAAREWGEMRRETKQVDVASESTTDWYERRVSPQFRSMVRDGIFKGWRGPAPWNAYAGGLAGFLRDRRSSVRALPLEDKIDVLGQILQGRTPHRFADLPEEIKLKALQHGWRGLPAGPSWGYGFTASILLRQAHQGWDQAWAQYVGKFYPHTRPETDKRFAGVARLWTRALAASDAYVKRAKGAQAAALKKLHADFTGAVKALHAEAGALTVRPRTPLDEQCTIVNQALRSQILRGEFVDTLRNYLIDAIVAKVRPATVNLCRNQFREGMVYSKDGVDKAIQDFGVASEALLRRDVSNALTRALLVRRLFVMWQNPYRSRLTGQNIAPTDEDIQADEKRLQDVLAKWPAKQKAYAAARAEAIRGEYKAAMDAVVASLLKRMVTNEGILQRDFYAKSETVDYTDQFQTRLEIRRLVWEGRKQNLGDLTSEGLPDASSLQVSLAAGMGAEGIATSPTVASMVPGFRSRGGALEALRWSAPTYPPPPQPWGFVTQIKIKPFFKSPRCDAIPFLPRFPQIDGDLSDWGQVRPLVLNTSRCPPFAKAAEGLPVYAGWNYQGFFFGYHVPQPRKYFRQATEYRRGPDGVSLIKAADWACQWIAGQADNCRLLFDTLDTRLTHRGDPNTQEFYVLPVGTSTDPNVPGMERIIANRKHAMERVGNGGWPYHRCSFRIFPPQPASTGPDGSGPYRKAKFTDDGYSVEIFIPRSLFNQPVFSPGWYIGFDVMIRIQGGAAREELGAAWAIDRYWAFIDNPSTWGDLLLLGTDAELRIQDASPSWPATRSVVPGRSYLVTVLDPDRNINLAAVDTVLLSAEVLARAGASKASDTEVYVLRETGKNTGIFRGFVNTQPGAGSEVRGALEVLAGRVVRLGYLDLGDSKGRRNVAYQAVLPVIAPLMQSGR